MAKNSVKKLSDKLVKVGDSITIYLYDNGWMVEANGRNKKDDWAGVKIMCNTLDEVNALIAEASEMERD